MFSASKLCQSVSTSGPSATWKPSPMNTSSSRSHAWVTRWAWPRRGLPGVLGQIEPLGLDAGRRARRRRARPGGRRSQLSTAAERLVDGLTGGPLLVDRRQRAELGLQLRQLAASCRAGWRRAAVIASRSPAAAISARAASRAAWMSSITGVLSRRRTGGTGSPRTDSGVGALTECRRHRSPGRPSGAPKSLHAHGREGYAGDSPRPTSSTDQPVHGWQPIACVGGPPRSTARSPPSPR